MADFEKLKKDLLEDGIIDANEVKRLKELLYEDGVIDKDEANFLFELNDAISGKDNAPEWREFFIQAICDFLLKDEVSPGEIDPEEELWLINKINNDGQVDDVEKDLLVALKDQSKNFPRALEDLLNN